MIEIPKGLKPLADDKRDFKFGNIFGAVELPQEDFLVSIPIKIKDQGDSDMCTAYAVTAVSEDQEGVYLNPLWQFAKIKQLEGDYMTWGADLRQACKSVVKFGSIEGDGVNVVGNRDEIANWRNWSPSLDIKAKRHAKESYFKITKLGYKDLFDAIRGALWKFKDDKRSIATGMIWRIGWSGTDRGIIKEDGVRLYGHAFKFFGQKKIDGEWYLVTQLSNGTSIGDKGIFYFSREIVNKNAVFGNFMFVDIPVDIVKYLDKNNLTIDDVLLVKWQMKFRMFIRKILNYIKNFKI